MGERGEPGQSSLEWTFAQADSHGSALWPEEVHWLQFAACNPCGPAQPALLTLAHAFRPRRSAVLQLALTPVLLSGSVLAGVLSSALYAVSQRCHAFTYMASLHSMRQQRRVVCATCSPFEVRSACCVQVGISYYFYITFLGYSALPFLERTEVGRGGEAGRGADGRVESPCTWRSALHGEDWPMRCVLLWLRHWQLPVAHTRTGSSPALGFGCLQVFLYPIGGVLLALPFAALLGFNPTQFVVRLYFPS